MRFKVVLLLSRSFGSLSSINAMAQTRLQGDGWKAIQDGATYIVSVDDKHELLAALQDFVESNDIRAGRIEGVGALNRAKLKFFDPATKQYDEKEFKEQFELANATGNVSIVGGKPLIHLHGTLGRRDYSALAGHLEEADIRGAGEFYVIALPFEVEKKKDESIGLNIYDF